MSDPIKVEIVGGTVWIGVMLFLIFLNTCNIATDLGKIANK